MADPDLKVRWGPLSNILFLSFHSFGVLWCFDGFSLKNKGGRGARAPPLDLPLHLVRHTRRDKYIKHRPFEVNRKFIKLDCGRKHKLTTLSFARRKHDILVARIQFFVTRIISAFMFMF